MKVQFRGWQEFDAKLGKMNGDLTGAMKTATEKAVLYVHSKVPAYPPTRPGQTYRRTGDLGRSITTEVKSISGGYQGSIGTNLVYAPWVISDRDVPGMGGPQAWMHKGRWFTLQGVVKDNLDDVMDIYRKAVRKLL
jgi:phage gpG-like protein